MRVLSAVLLGALVGCADVTAPPEATPPPPVVVTAADGWWTVRFYDGFTDVGSCHLRVSAVLDTEDKAVSWCRQVLDVVLRE